MLVVVEIDVPLLRNSSSRGLALCVWFLAGSRFFRSWPLIGLPGTASTLHRFTWFLLLSAGLQVINRCKV